MAEQGTAAHAIAEYVARRLRLEIDGQPRGAAARIAEKSGLTTAHIANLKNRRSNAAQDAAEKLAAYWGMTLTELVDRALEEASLPRVGTGRATDDAGTAVRATDLYKSAPEEVRWWFDNWAPFTSGKAKPLTVKQVTEKLIALLNEHEVSPLVIPTDDPPGTKPDDGK